MFGVPVKMKMSVKVRANLVRVVSNVCKVFRINILDTTAQSNYFRLLYAKSWRKYLSLTGKFVCSDLRLDSQCATQVTVTYLHKEETINE